MELGYTSLALRSMFGTNNGIAGQVLVGFGTDEQKARWLAAMASACAMSPSSSANFAASSAMSQW